MIKDGVRTSRSQEVIDQVMVGRTVVMVSLYTIKGLDMIAIIEKWSDS